MVMPSVGVLKFPRPMASRPIDARMAPATEPTRLAVMYGIRFGSISLKMIPMPLVPLRILLDHAAENGYGLAAFNVNNMEQIQAIMKFGEGR